MAAVYSSSPLDRVFAQVQASSAPRTLPNTSGTWNSAGAKLCRHTNLSLTANRPVAEMPYKTGTRSTMIGVTARTSGSFSYSGPLIPAGVAGTAPDLDPFFQGAFGQAPASGVYTFLDSGFIPVAMFRYNKSGGVNPTNWYAGGGIVQRLTINLGGE